MKICHRHHWNFVGITSRDDNMDVIDAILSLSGIFGYWIGGNDMARHGEYWWPSIGKPMRFIQWDKNEPSTKGHCIEITDKNMGRGMQWSVDDCWSKKVFVCSSLKVNKL